MFNTISTVLFSKELEYRWLDQNFKIHFSLSHTFTGHPLQQKEQRSDANLFPKSKHSQEKCDQNV
jgi:adenosylmethionine-8-amino-7-oxononanoate aminotransferase